MIVVSDGGERYWSVVIKFRGPGVLRDSAGFCGEPGECFHFLKSLSGIHAAKVQF